jgi:hypothetical protein
MSDFYPPWTPLGAYLKGLERQTERQRELMEKSEKTLKTILGEDKPHRESFPPLRECSLMPERTPAPLFPSFPQTTSRTLVVTPKRRPGFWARLWRRLA